MFEHLASEEDDLSLKLSALAAELKIHLLSARWRARTPERRQTARS